MKKTKDNKTQAQTIDVLQYLVEHNFDVIALSTIQKKHFFCNSPLDNTTIL